jgi:hypothetical protein
MIATTRFRYVERDCFEVNDEHFAYPHRVRFLQQWWAFEEDKTSGEWRDIPLVEEK